MTDVCAVRPAVNHPEHRETADRKRRGIRGLGNSRTDVRSVADDAQTGWLRVNLGRAGGEAEEGQVEDPDVDLPSSLSRQGDRYVNARIANPVAASLMKFAAAVAGSRWRLSDVAIHLPVEPS